MGLPGSEDSLTIVWAVSTQYQRVTDGQTDVQAISITCAVWLTHVKNGSLRQVCTRAEMSREICSDGLKQRVKPYWTIQQCFSFCVICSELRRIMNDVARVSNDLHLRRDRKRRPTWYVCKTVNWLLISLFYFINKILLIDPQRNAEKSCNTCFAASHSIGAHADVLRPDICTNSDSDDEPLTATVDTATDVSATTSSPSVSATGIRQLRNVPYCSAPR